MKLFFIKIDRSYVCVAKAKFFLCLITAREVAALNLDTGWRLLAVLTSSSFTVWDTGPGTHYIEMVVPRANLDVVTKKKSQTTTGNQTRSFKLGRSISDRTIGTGVLLICIIYKPSILNYLNSNSLV
jgi:hypothetical protein